MNVCIYSTFPEIAMSSMLAYKKANMLAFLARQFGSQPDANGFEFAAA